MFNMEAKEYVKMIPFVAAIAAVVITTVRSFRKDTSHHINKSIQKDQAKVATMVDVDELGDTTAFCRCWKSSKFPYCDGSHNGYNMVTGDNVGPVVIKKKK